MKYTKWISLGILLLAFFACDNEEEIKHSITENAYLRGMMINGKASYAPVLVAQSSDAPVTFTATDNKDKKYTLTTYWGHKLRYRWVPDTANYKISTENLTFNFIANYNDRKEVKKTVSVGFSTVPKPFKVTDVNHDPSADKITVEWTNAGADHYMISIVKDIDEKPIFQSLSLKTDKPTDIIKFSFDKSTLKWYNTSPTSGEYLLVVHAFNLSGSKVQGEFISGKKFTLKQ